MVRIYIILAFAFMFPGSASAELTSNDILVVLEHGTGEQKIYANGYIHGAASALEWADVYIRKRQTKSMFCIPTSLALTPQQEIDILKDGIIKRPSIGKHPVGFALLEAYLISFPCSNE